MSYVVEDFMISDLDLRGTELNVFALIHSFKVYKGSLDYICSFVGVSSVNTVKSALSSLIEKGLIEKEDTPNPYKPNVYRSLISSRVSSRNRPKEIMFNNKEDSSIGEWD